MASSNNAAAIISEFTTLYTDSYCDIAVPVLFVYDFIITIGDESKYFWSNRLTGATALFYLNRYFALIFYVFNVLFDWMPIDDESCAATQDTARAIQFILYISPGAFTALRVFALSQSWVLAIPTFFLSVFPTIGVNLAVFGFDATGVKLPVFGCTSADSITIELAKAFTIASRSSLILADFIAILVTWLKLSSRNAPHDSHEQAAPRLLGLNKKNTFMHVLLHDGTIYFVIIGVLNCLHLTFTLLSFQIGFLQNVSYISAFTEPLTAILVSRFLLHLQSVNYRTSGVGSSQVSSVFFERVIGSLDASLSSEDFFGDPDAMERSFESVDCEQLHGDSNILPESEFASVDEIGTSEVVPGSLSPVAQ